MALRMSTPWKHPKTGIYWFRKAVPKRLRHLVGRVEINRTLKTKEPSEAVIRYHRVALEVDAEWRALLARPVPLTDAQIDGIAGQFGRWLVSRHAMNPGEAEKWAKRVESEKLNIHKRRFGGMTSTYMGDVKIFLNETGIELADDWELMKVSAAAAKAGIIAKETLARRAVRDYKPDSRIDESFPVWSEIEPTLNVKNRRLIVAEHFDKCAATEQWGRSTIKSWRPMLEKLTVFYGKDNIAGITRKQALEWKDHLLDDLHLSPKTVREGYVAAARSFFNWAVEYEKATANPFTNISIKDDKSKLPARPSKSLDDDEAELILSESLRVGDNHASEEFRLAKRWIPWTLAYTGARVNEITQARGSDLTKRRIRYDVEVDGVDEERVDEVWVLRLTPDAGTIKGGRTREVPLHPHLVEQGLPAVFAAAGAEPVFYDPKLRRKEDAGPQYEKVAEKLADWVREIGVGDENVSPNHGWRHRFNQVARAVRMDPEIRDAIKGHKPRTEGEMYGGDVPLSAKWIEIKRIKRIKVSEPTGGRPGVEHRKKKSVKRMETARNAKAREKAEKAAARTARAARTAKTAAPVEEEHGDW